jgi:hypothetical protein
MEFHDPGCCEEKSAARFPAPIPYFSFGGQPCRWTVLLTYYDPFTFETRNLESSARAAYEGSTSSPWIELISKTNKKRFPEENFPGSFSKSMSRV